MGEQADLEEEVHHCTVRIHHDNERITAITPSCLSDEAYFNKHPGLTDQIVDELNQTYDVTNLPPALSKARINIIYYRFPQGAATGIEIDHCDALCSRDFYNPE